jgi:hypothetical protein
MKGKVYAWILTDPVEPKIKKYISHSEIFMTIRSGKELKAIVNLRDYGDRTKLVKVEKGVFKQVFV